MRFVVADFALQARRFGIGNVRRIADDQVEEWRPGSLRQQIHFDELDAACNVVWRDSIADGVATGDFRGRRGKNRGTDWQQRKYPWQRFARAAIHKRAQ